MSFQIATLNETSDPSRATNFRPLRLGGAEGVVARHVRALGSQAEDPWSLCGNELCTLSGGTPGLDALFFQPSQTPLPDGSLEAYLLTGIHGVTSYDRTDLVCTFLPHRIREIASGAWDIESVSSTTFCESLSLSGGVSSGNWKWSAAPLSIGAAVVGSGCGGNCSTDQASHECCGKC